MPNGTSDLQRLSWSQVCAQRLARHSLLAPAEQAELADIASAICGVHAQIMSAAELSIAVRIATVTRAEIQKALWTEHSLVKTFGPRGTVHVLAMRDLPLWAGALSALPPHPSSSAPNASLTAEQTDTLVAAIAEVLADAELTVDELTEALVGRVGAWAGDLVMPAFQGMWPRWRQVTATAASRGALCFGPNRGRMVTYTSPHRWLPGFRPVEGQQALAELVRRYLYAYGPATPQQFAQWLAAPKGWATALFDSLAKQLQQVEVDGVAAWRVAGDTAGPVSAPQSVRLLPYFDAYTVGSHPRDKVFPGPAAQRALAGGQAGNFPVLLIDGIVAGVWHQRRSGRRITITVEPLVEMTSPQRRALDEQVERIGELLEGTPQLTFGTVTVGPHA